MIRTSRFIAISVILVLSYVTDTLAQQCCYSDPCSRARICAKVGRTLKDSCPRRYSVRGGCSLRRNCCYSDQCNKKKICADATETFTDSCLARYSVGNDCSVRRHCCYTDPCDRERICADVGEMVTDSCPRRYTVREDCSLLSHCCYLDVCNKKKICVDEGQTLIDSCPGRYTVRQGCLLRRQCCYEDPCNRKRICAHAGETLTYSCKRTYNVGQDCSLEIPSSPSTGHVPGVGGSGSGNGDAVVEQTILEAEENPSRMCGKNVIEPSLACGCGMYLNLFEEGKRWKTLEDICLKEYGRVSDSGSRECSTFVRRFVGKQLKTGSALISVSALQSYFVAACEKCVGNPICSELSSVQRSTLAERHRKWIFRLCVIISKFHEYPVERCRLIRV